MPRAATKSRTYRDSRKQLIFRPWITTSQYDVLTIRTVVHVDIFAYLDGFSTLYFDVHVTQSGKYPIARDVYRYRPDINALVSCAALSHDARLTYWHVETSERFAAPHATLVSTTRALHGMALGAGLNATLISTLCHYVRVVDANPWPRGHVNSYQPYTRRAGQTGQTGQGLEKISL